MRETAVSPSSMTTAAACARCSLERHALKPVNYDNTAWSQLGARCQCERSCNAGPSRQPAEPASPRTTTPPIKHQARSGWVSPVKPLSMHSPEAAEAPACSSVEDTALVVATACKLLDEVVCPCPQQTATKVRQAPSIRR